MSVYSQHYNKLETPQSDKADSTQIKNNAGGYTFQLNCWKRLERWLIIGSEGGTYYVSESNLTKENAKVVEECLNEDGVRTIDLIVSISDSGRAPKNEQAIFALALAASDSNPKTRTYALSKLSSVCRIPTHLFMFAEAVQNFRGWGSALRKAVANWYNEKPEQKLMYHIVKYQQREGWSNRDLLRLSHPKTDSDSRQAIYRYVAAGPGAMEERFVQRYDRANQPSEKQKTLVLKNSIFILRVER